MSARWLPPVSAISLAGPREPLLDDEQRRQNERYRAQQLDENVQRRARRVLEGVADRVADDRCLMCGRALLDDAPIRLSEISGLDKLLGVIPGPAGVVEEGGQQDPADCPHHQEAGNALPT